MNTFEDYKSRNRQFFAERRREHQMEMALILACQVLAFAPLIILLVFGLLS